MQQSRKAPEDINEWKARSILRRDCLTEDEEVRSRSRSRTHLYTSTKVLAVTARTERNAKAGTRAVPGSSWITRIMLADLDNNAGITLEISNSQDHNAVRFTSQPIFPRVSVWLQGTTDVLELISGTHRIGQHGLEGHIETQMFWHQLDTVPTSEFQCHSMWILSSSSFSQVHYMGLCKIRANNPD